MRELTINEIKKDKDYKFSQYYTNKQIKNHQDIEVMRSHNIVVFMELFNNIGFELHLIGYDDLYQLDYNLFVKEEIDEDNVNTDKEPYWDNIDGFKCMDFNDFSEDKMIQSLITFLKEHYSHLYKQYFLVD